MYFKVKSLIDIIKKCTFLKCVFRYTFYFINILLCASTFLKYTYPNPNQVEIQYN